MNNRGHRTEELAVSISLVLREVARMFPVVLTSDISDTETLLRSDKLAEFARGTYLNLLLGKM